MYTLPKLKKRSLLTEWELSHNMKLPCSIQIIYGKEYGIKYRKFIFCNGKTCMLYSNRK